MTSEAGGEVAFGQAAHILRLFGGAHALARAMEAAGVPRDPASIYKWTYAKARGGTDGLVPTSAYEDVLLAAEKAGIELTGADFLPRKRRPKSELLS